MAGRPPQPGTLSVTYHLFAASQQVGALLAEALADGPLGPSAYAFYSALRESQPNTPTDLARLLGMPVTTVLDTLASMQRRGHVVRLRNPRDGRSYLVQLTELGEQLHDETEVLFSRAERRLLAHLGVATTDITRALSALKAASERAAAELRDEVNPAR